MEQRRFFLFLTLSMAVLIGWSSLLQWQDGQQVPDNVEEAALAVDEPDVTQQDLANATAEADATSGDDSPTTTAESPTKPTDADGKLDQTDQPPVEESARPAPQLATFPEKMVVLGSLDVDSGYLAEVRLTTQGAAISQIALNDRRYTEVDNPQQPLKIVSEASDTSETTRRTLQTTIPAIEQQLKPFNTNLNAIHWEVIETKSEAGVDTSVSFRFVSPDGRLEVVKRFSLQPVDQQGPVSRTVRDSDPAGYEIEFELSITNHSDAPIPVHYGMQGPTHLPLENADNTRKFRDVKIGYANEVITKTADEIAEEAAETADGGSKEQWKQESEDGSGEQRAFSFLGVDVQYFTSLLFPQGDQLKEHYIDVVKAQLIRPERETTKSDISVLITSRVVELAAGAQMAHRYTLYAGPKRRMLLEPLGAVESIDFYAIPGLGWISKPISYGMLYIMNMFHDWGLPYGIAIILLTVFVRGAMYPISRKQAAGAKKMKELQPRITELKQKYKKDKEKLAKAQMELFSKANYNPLSGCLPLILQLPIFIGLYQALYNAVDLRMAPFLWISNLAAPDALFRLGFSIPFLGSDFNLLPLVTVCLWIVQQKMFMPPATDDQTALQQKMMTYMMVFFGFMFYRMPAGLCVYFITSTLWGMAERKLLDYGKAAEPTQNAAEPAATPKDRKRQATANQPDKPNNFLGRLSAKITAAAKMQQQAVKESSGNGKSSRSSHKKNKQSRSR